MALRRYFGKSVDNPSRGRSQFNLRPHRRPSKLTKTYIPNGPVIIIKPKNKDAPR